MSHCFLNNSLLLLLFFLLFFETCFLGGEVMFPGRVSPSVRIPVICLIIYSRHFQLILSIWLRQIVCFRHEVQKAVTQKLSRFK